MKFLRPLLGFTRLDHQRNSDIRKKLEVDNIVEDIKLYQKKWNCPLQRMNRNRIPQLAFRNQPDRKRDLADHDKDGETKNTSRSYNGTGF
jgi:hypothetical protein